MLPLSPGQVVNFRYASLQTSGGRAASRQLPSPLLPLAAEHWQLQTQLPSS